MGRALLWIFTWIYTFAFGANAIRRRGRGTHTYGVAGRGRIRLVDHPHFPEHPFLQAGRELPVTVRHANVVPEDDAHKGFRGMALRLHGSDAEGPLDLLMNTGPRGVFWHAWNFRKIVFAAATGLNSARRYVQTTTPPMHEHTQLGARRAPSSFANLFFYARVAFDYHAVDGHPRLVRFRARPVDDRDDTDGLPPEGSEDRRVSWTRARLPDEDRPADYLRGTFVDTLAHGGTIEYRLQLQIHDLTPEDTNDIYDIKRDWDPASHPWMDVGTITLDEPLPEAEAEALEFGIYNMPSSFGVPRATSITDYRSIGSMRVDIYPRLQRLRRLIRRLDGRPGPGRYPLAPDPHPRRGALTVQVPIRDAEGEEQLDQLLRHYGSDVDSRPDLPFPLFDELHFARFVILPSDEGGPGDLIYSANVDGRPESHLYRLVHRAPALPGFYQHCVGWDPSWGPEELYSYLLRHRKRTRLLHEGSPGRAAKQIAADESLRRAICDVLEPRQRDGGWTDMSALQIVEQVRDEIRRRSDLPQGPSPARAWHQQVDFYVHKVGQFTLVVIGPPVALAVVGGVAGWALGSNVALATLAGPGAYLAALGVGALILRQAERTDPVEPIERTWDERNDVQEVANLEDHQVQNQLSMRLAVKPTWFRRPLFHVVLRIGHYLTRYHYNDGQLSGIPTIHFARFLIDSDTRRMIFFSNYDGNWEEYLGDFLGKGAFAVVPIWTNCAGCAETRFLLSPTPGFGELFRAYIRRHQMPTQVWYSAYRDLSLVNINDNARMRDELWSVDTEDSARSWLDRLAR